MAFTRQRIEAWCDDVAQYLRDGTICHNVTGYLEATRSKGSTADLYTTESDTQVSNSPLLIQPTSNYKVGRISPAKSHGTFLLISKDRSTKNNYRSKTSPFWSHEGRMSIDQTRVKSACNLYQEQQRKTECLMQGLPVESKRGLIKESRSPSKAFPHTDVSNFVGQRKRSAEIVYNRPRSSSQPRFRHYKSPTVYAQMMFGSSGNLLRDFNATKPGYSAVTVWSGAYDPHMLRQGSFANILYTQRMNTRSQEVYRASKKY